MKSVLLSIFFVNIVSVTAAQNLLHLVRGNVGLIEFSYKLGSDTIVQTGTGTLICKPLNNEGDSSFVFLLTNKHVLPLFEQSSSIDFKITNPDSNAVFPYLKLSIPVFQNNTKYDSHVLISNDEDIAIIEISSIYVRSALDVPAKRLFGIDYLATYSDIKEEHIEIGDQVFFWGYPSLFYDEKNIAPIFRNGYISTDPLTPYHFNNYLQKYFLNKKTLNGFLIDANVFGGSSGSLVCMYPPEYMQTQKLSPNIPRKRRRNWILGILAESYFDVATSIPFSQRVNIGGVISSEKILSLINSYRPEVLKK